MLELVQIDETRITDEEIQALHPVIAALCDCIQRTTADLAAIELTRHARIVGGYDYAAGNTVDVYLSETFTYNNDASTN